MIQLWHNHIECKNKVILMLLFLCN